MATVDLRIVTTGADTAAKALNAIALPLIAAGALSLKFAADFDAAMTKSLAIMGRLDAGMREHMEQAARDVAKSTVFSATEAADALYFLSSAGLTAAQSVTALPKVAAFAQAGMFDLSKATEYLTDSVSALGLGMEDMGRVSDVLVQAANKSNASVEQFAASLTNKAAASMRQANISIEEGVAVLEAYAAQGKKGQTAGEAYSIALREMGRAATGNQAAFKAAGVEVFDASGKMNNMATIMGQLEKHMQGMGAQQRVMALEMMGFKSKTVDAIKPLIGMSEAIKKYEADLRSAGGVAAAAVTEVAATRAETEVAAATPPRLPPGIAGALTDTIGRSTETDGG